METDARRVLSNLIPLEREIETDDGRWFLVGVRPYRTVEDKINGVMTCVDISANKANEAALAEARDIFSTLFPSNPIPTVLTRLQDGLIIDANDAYLHFFELPRAALVGSTRRQLEGWLTPKDQVALSERIRRESHLENFEITTAHRSGKTKTALVSIQRVEHEAFADITELKQAQETLRRSEERLRLTLESVTDYAFITLDAAGRIIDWRGGAEQIFGYSRNEILGQSFALLFTPEDRTQGAPGKEIEQARATGRALDERQHPCWHSASQGLN